MALWGVIQGQNNRGSFRVIGSLRIMNSGSVRVIQVVIQGRLGLQLTASYFGLPVRVSGTNLALARVRGWGKGSNYLKFCCVRVTASCFGLPVRVSGTNLALARVRGWGWGWGKGSNYLKSSCVRGTASCF